MGSPEIERLKQKFLKGMELAIKRLVERTKKEDGELVISKNGKVIRIKARDIQ